ncbi:hypothetical protein GCM10028862_10110 [Luteimonas pelagia]
MRCATPCIAMLAVFVLGAAGSANADSIARSGLPPTTGGVFVSCGEPERFLVVARRPGETRVEAIGPEGAEWSFDLPPMQYEYDQYQASPHGDAVVVTTEFAAGNSFLVTRQGAMRIEAGHVGGVDFEAGRVLIPMHATDDGTGAPEILVGTFDLRSRAWIGKHRVTEPVEITVDRDFLMRLSKDGKHFYYVVEERPGIPSRVEIRDVRNGRPVKQRSSLMGHGDIYDLLLLTATDGYLVAREGFFAVRNGVTTRISMPGGLGRAWRVLDLGHSGLQAVKADKGWAVRHWASGRWIASGRGHGEIHPAPGGWMLLEASTHRHGITYYRYRDRRALVARAVHDGEFPGQRGRGILVCANAYGAMGYEEGRFRWTPSHPVD